MAQEERSAGGSTVGTAGLLLLACFIAVGLAFFWMRGGRGAVTPAHAMASGQGAAGEAAGRLPVGAIARLQSQQNRPIWVVVDAEAWRALWHAQGTRDSRALDAIVRSGRAFVADEDTEAQILGEGGEFYRVRILEGACQGRAGWVPAANLTATGREREL